MFENPTYIVFDVTGRVAEKVRKIRQNIDPERADLNIEISISGSSGLGYLAPNQPFDIICQQLTEVCNKISPFWCHFDKIKKFPNTDIYYLSLKHQKPFFNSIKILQESNINFLSNPFSYEAHCTLTLPVQNDLPNAKLISEIDFRKIKIPKEKFYISSLALYEETKTNSFKTIFRKKLEGGKMTKKYL